MGLYNHQKPNCLLQDVPPDVVDSIHVLTLLYKSEEQELKINNLQFIICSADPWMSETMKPHTNRNNFRFSSYIYVGHVKTYSLTEISSCGVHYFNTDHWVMH